MYVCTCEADFHKPGTYGGRVRVWANPWDVFHRTPSRSCRSRRAAVDLFRDVFSVRRDFFAFLFSFPSFRTHTAYCKYEAALLHVPLYYQYNVARMPTNSLMGFVRRYIRPTIIVPENK